MEKDSVVWDEVFSLGIEPIDDQHKILVGIINELFTACKEGVMEADKAFLETAKETLEYTETHFADEEDYMRGANYPRFAEHKKQHEAFIAAIQKSIDDFEAGNAEPIEMARFLKKWLLNHIAVTDNQYVPYLSAVFAD